MNKWLKIGGIAGAIALGVTVLGIAAFAILRPVQVNARAAARVIPQAIGLDRFNPAPADFGSRDQFQQFGPRGQFGGQIDQEALLAEALGITKEELQAAYDKAHTAGVQQALDKGLITQDEADMMLARIQLRSYLDRDKLTAKALGITVAELQAAYDEGKPLAVIAYELGLDPATIRTNVQTAYKDAVQQAVSDGVITQDQADQLQNDRGFGLAGPRGRGDFGGPGAFDGFRGRGGFGGK
jgi:hypothetical protein